MKINEIYINGLKKCYLDFNACMKDVEVIEKEITITYDDLNNWIKDNTKFLDKMSNKTEHNENDVDILEDKLIEYENIIKKLTERIKPYTTKLLGLKNDISNIYEKIMNEYGKNYTEEEIINAIKKEIE